MIIIIIILCFLSKATDKDPHYDLLKDLLSDARPLPVKLDQLPQVESRYSAAKAWIDRAGRTFTKKSSQCSLIEVSQIKQLLVQ